MTHSNDSEGVNKSRVDYDAQLISAKRKGYGARNTFAVLN